MKSSPTARAPHRLQQADHLARRGAARPGQAGAVDGVHPGAVLPRELGDDRGPGAVLPAPPKRAPSSLISVSAKKLSE